jgi:acetolactate synthase-1/2/3 large subunit
LIKLTDKIVSENTKLEITEWQQLVKTIRTDLSIPDSANKAEDGYVELHRFIYRLFEQLKNDDQIVPCSSGGTYTGTMQVMLNKTGQKIITSSGLAGMGFGLSGAIGVGLADKNKRTILLEGDGGFAQNLQELGTLKATNLNLKTFIFDNRGYASIRTTQKTYFNNHYVGCDEETGLGLPNWKLLVDAYSIASYEVTPETAFDSKFMELLNSDKAAVFVVKLDPDQLYFPKLGSRINPSGVMASSPIHLMDPQLNEADSKKYIRYI